ncbi:type II secretion system minor pseudopilin GspK [Gallaecimonas xiamenensis]|uniref:Type II secretion system protein K n=1 Tax=Gallaecimonas xiamenensis 3-C-1 TaxID=745411 RepID=K2JSR9_9GAMM|nr:type II secretion system minor pseudopilin GspK [Gallaecimonas xiamenensis]EKE77562.1 general secretion pathway protein K [Gallaecimonas xiamenensis 3-C-1]
MNQRQRGVALITVMLILAIMVVVAAGIGGRLGINIRRTGNQIGQHQAYFYALSGEAFAKLALHRLLKEEDGELNLSQDWAKPQAFPVEGGSIKGQIRDGHGCFNLNSLQGDNDQDRQSHRKAFQALLEALEVDSFEAETVSYSLADWLDDDSRLDASFGAEDAEYQGREFPYLAANGLMTDVSELRMVNGVTAAIYLKVRPYVCVLDDNSFEVNVNTLPSDRAAVLAAVLTPLTLSDAEGILGARPEEGFDSLDQVWEEPALASLQDPLPGAKEALVLKSDRYFVSLEGRFQDRPMYMESLLKKDDNNKLTTLWRRLGGRL